MLDRPTATDRGTPAGTDAAVAKPALPPRLRLPATVQTLLSLVWMGGFEAQLLRGPAMRTMRVLGVGEVVAIRDPDALRQLFTADREIVRAGEINARVLPFLGPKSLMKLDGDRHLRMRRLLLPPFHGEAVRGYRALIEEITAKELDRWPIGEEFPVRPSMQRIALEVILRAVVGVRDPARLERLRRVLPKVLAASPLTLLAEARYPWLAQGAIGRLRPWVRWRRNADELLDDEIAAHRATPDGRDDILALLIAARDEEGQGLSDDELRDQLLTLLLAGHETTANSLAWCFERLTRHPQAMERLERELDAGEETYLDAVVNETLRSRPVLELTWRVLSAPYEIGGYLLPAGTIITPTIRGVQASEAFDEAQEFRPERFLEGDAAPYTLIPFGGGARRCLGASFAVMEMKTVLRSVLTRFGLQAPRPAPERRSRLRGFTTVPSRGARVVAHARSATAGPVAQR